MTNCRNNVPTWAAAQPALRDWYRSPLGSSLLDTVAAKFDDILPGIFGYQGMQVGQISPDHDLLASAGLHRRIIIDSCAESDNVQISGELEQLPISSDCMHLVFYPHALEFCDNPHGALREADRVLTDDGHLLILGVNPYSMFGLGRAAGAFNRGVMWRGKTYSRARIADWLSVLGFRLICVETVFLRPPINRPRLLNSTRHLEKLQGVMGFAGGVYLIHARKQVAALTQVRKQWARPRNRLTAEAFAQRAHPSGRQGNRGQRRTADIIWLDPRTPRADN